LDRRWGLTGSSYSPALAQQMVWLAAKDTYAEAVATFARIGRRSIPASTIWDLTQRYGERLRAYLARQQAAVGVERADLPPVGADHDRPLEISLEGAWYMCAGKAGRSSRPGQSST